MVALTRGPLVFCLESVENTADIFSAIVNPQSISARFDPDLLGGV